MTDSSSAEDETKTSDVAPITVLILEDDANLRPALVAMVSRIATRCLESGTLEEARKLLETEPIDAALVDLSLPDGSGLELLDEFAGVDAPEFIVVTGDASADTAVDALKRGALDYLTKPIDRPRLRSVLSNVERTRALKNQVSGLRGHLRELGRFESMVGRSKAMQEIYAMIERVAPRDASVFLTGESGTGKEVAAETIHRMSPRSEAPFVTVNCGAIAPSLVESELFGHEKGAFTGADRRHKGFFERAEGGTLFLDEITEMPTELQVKLLRVIESREVVRVGGSQSIEVDVRIIAASNRDPDEAIAADEFREDLYYRLNVFPVHLPPLREREGDVALLADHFVSELEAIDDEPRTLTPRARELLASAGWPGNVRELRNVVERAAILSDTPAIDVDALPDVGEAPRSGPAPSEADDGRLPVEIGSSLADVERQVILATLEANDGNKKEAAGILGISLKTLYNRLNVYEAEATARSDAEGD